MIPDFVMDHEGQNEHLNFVAIEKKAVIYFLVYQNEHFTSTTYKTIDTKTKLKKWEGNNKGNKLISL